MSDFNAKDAFLSNIESTETPPLDPNEPPQEPVDEPPPLAAEEGSNELDQGDIDQNEPEAQAVQDEGAEGEAEETNDSDEGEGVEHDSSYVIDGVSYTQEELQSSMMMNADYTKKTQELAAERRKLETEQERAAAALGLLTQQAANQAAQYQQLDWNRLAGEDPEQYTKMRTEADQAEAHLKQTRHSVDAFFQQIEAKKGEELQAKAQECVKTLKATNPDWSNALYYQLVDEGVARYGYTKDELLQQTDPRLFQMMIDARKYQQGRQVATEKTAALSPKKTLKQSVKADMTPTKAVSNKRRAEDSLRQLKQSHSVKDAQAAFFERIR